VAFRSPATTTGVRCAWTKALIASAWRSRSPIAAASTWRPTRF